jgi:hypothetical protein
MTYFLLRLFKTRKFKDPNKSWRLDFDVLIDRTKSLRASAPPMACII